MVFHLADDVHFTRAAVKLQRQHLITVDQLHWRRFPAFDVTFRLFRAQIKGKTQAMLGDHRRHIALFLMRFIRRVDQLYAITMVELTRLLVIDVCQKTQMRLRVDRRGIGGVGLGNGNYCTLGAFFNRY